MTSPPIRQPVRIIGIDPGLRRTGWGVIETEGNRLVFIGCGSVEPPDDLPLATGQPGQWADPGERFIRPEDFAKVGPRVFQAVP